MAEAGLAAATGPPLDVGKDLVVDPVIDEISSKSRQKLLSLWR